MSSPIVPMIVLGGVIYANNFIEKKSVFDVAPLLYTGVGALLLTGFAQIPDMRPVAVLLGWTAVAGYLITSGALTNLLSGVKLAPATKTTTAKK